jgi:hypothetical protein
VPIAPKPCGFSNALEKGIPQWKAMNFLRSGRRSQARKLRMGEIQSASEGKRKRSLLSSGAARADLAQLPQNDPSTCRALQLPGVACSLFSKGVDLQYPSAHAKNEAR